MQDQGSLFTRCFYINPTVSELLRLWKTVTRKTTLLSAPTMQANHFLSTKCPACSPFVPNPTHQPPLSPSFSAVRFRPRPRISAVAAPPLKTPKMHSMPPEKVEIFKSLENWATQNVLPLLKPVEKCWQPQNFLPDPTLPFSDFTEQVKELRERTAGLPDEYFVVLVGDMITEDAIPTYQTMINTLDGVKDETGASSSPWATWTRCWTAEENRHGDLLRTYLYLSGRVDMLMIEKTLQYLIRAGMVLAFNNFLFNLIY